MNRELIDALIQATYETPSNSLEEISNQKGQAVVEGKKFLKDDKLIAVRSDTSTEYFPEHTHDYVEIVYMYQGQTEHIINGERVLLKEGEFLFLSQKCRQENLPSTDNDIAVNFIVHPLFFENMLNIMSAEETLLHRFIIQCLQGDEGKANYLHFRVSGILPLQNLAENLIWNLINDIPNQRKINESTMALLFTQLLNNANEVEYSRDENNIILRVLAYIDSHYADGSLTDLARLMYYDFNALSKQIKKQTGKNYTDLVQEKRLSQACFLLKNTNFGVAEISEKVGYENISYFHRLFNKTYGVSPKKYRDTVK